MDLLRAGPRRAGELAAAAQVSPAALSRHLRVLRTSGLVEADGIEADARLRIYRLRQAPFAALQAWLDQVHAFWGEHLDAFAAHANRIAGEPTDRIAGEPTDHTTDEGAGHPGPARPDSDR